MAVPGDTHEPGRPPVPLALHTPSPRAQPVAATRLNQLASITGPREQQRWHRALDRMEQEEGADLAQLQSIRRWITTGITLDLERLPEPCDFENTRTVEEHADEVRARIQEYIDFQALIPVPDSHPCPFGIQPLHAIIKPPKKPRLVIDLSRNLNDDLVYEYFSYSTVRHAVELSTPDCWYSKLDLSNCFLSFPLHPSAMPHFIFRFEGQLYQFTRMPFGLSSAPRICTLLLSVVASELAYVGISRQLRYLDDFLFVDHDEQSSQLSLGTALRVMTDFGLVVNPDKTEGPAQRLAFLGIQLDSTEQTLSCTPERLTELRSLLADAAGRRDISLKELQTLIGKLQFAAQVLPGARPFTRRVMDLIQRRREGVLQQHANDLNPRRRHFAVHNAHLRIDRPFRADIHFWRDHLAVWNGRQRWRSAQSAPFVFASDASLNGFGFYIESLPLDDSADTSAWPRELLPGHGYSGAYSARDHPLHHESAQMTWCELFAVYAALVTYRSVLRDCCVLFFVDNLTDVYIIREQRTRAARLAGLLREIFTIAVECNLSLWAEHRPGVDNVLADFLSRPDLHGGRSGDQIALAWSRAYPCLSHRLHAVSLVYSHQFITQRVLPSSTA
jgi:hypothetical protein